MADRYLNYLELQNHEVENQDYRIAWEKRNSTILVMAPHGGKIEPYTSSICEWIAGNDFDYYKFEGLKDGDNRILHITSHNFDEPIALKALAEVRTVLTIHGHRNTENEFVMLGGLDQELCHKLTQAILQAGFHIEEADLRLSGKNPLNICNRGKNGKGAQLEISYALRKRLNDNPADRKKFVHTIRSVLLKEYKIVIREMDIQDYNLVINLWRNTQGIGLSEADSRENIQRFLERNPGLSCVVQAEGDIIGAVLSSHDGRRGYLHHLAIREDYRRQGLGKELVYECLARLHMMGIAKCHVFVFRNNPEGMKFWSSIEWKGREDLIIMSKEI